MVVVMKIWTYEQSNARSPYWMSSSTPVCLIEEDNGLRTWRRISDGAYVDIPAYDYHQARLLDSAFWPPWLRAMSDAYVDVGI